MRIDLHTHSSVSDGTDSPTELVDAAAAAGVDVLALADHDTARGWDEAGEAANAAGIELVPAIEVSSTWRGADVHMLAYWPDGANSPLEEMLAAIRAGRLSRIPQMLGALAAHGIRITEEQVRRAAGGAVSIGRPHVADALVAAGVVGSRDEAFATWVGEGMPGHVPKPAPTLPHAITVVRAAGGLPVIAHPWGRGSRRVLDDEALAELAEAGLVGLEVDHMDHDDAARAALRAIADRLDLVATGGSDYHGTGKHDVHLATDTTSPQAYAALLERRARIGL
ncbi:MAG: PHP domain-containing protein [Jiangellales bacterium]